MKPLNFFKKLNSKIKTIETKNIQPLDKNQLEKIIGGTDSTEMSPDKAATFGKGLAG